MVLLLGPLHTGSRLGSLRPTLPALRGPRSSLRASRLFDLPARARTLSDSDASHATLHAPRLGPIFRCRTRLPLPLPHSCSDYGPFAPYATVPSSQAGLMRPAWTGLPGRVSFGLARSQPGPLLRHVPSIQAGSKPGSCLGRPGRSATHALTHHASSDALSRPLRPGRPLRPSPSPRLGWPGLYPCRTLSARAGSEAQLKTRTTRISDILRFDHRSRPLQSDRPGALTRMRGRPDPVRHGVADNTPRGDLVRDATSSRARASAAPSRCRCTIGVQPRRYAPRIGGAAPRGQATSRPSLVPRTLPPRAIRYPTRRRQRRWRGSTPTTPLLPVRGSHGVQVP